MRSVEPNSGPTSDGSKRFKEPTDRTLPIAWSAVNPRELVRCSGGR